MASADFRESALRCLQFARRAIRDDDRAVYLELAETWTRMAEKADAADNHEDSPELTYPPRKGGKESE
jgi:hypothetical protein